MNCWTKSKVTNFKVIFTIKEQVFWFKVSMANILTMAVWKTFHELFEVVSHHSLRKWTSMSNKIEELTSLAKFKSNEPLLSFLIFLYMLTDSIADLLNDMRMIQFFHCFNFRLYQFPCVSPVFHLLFQKLNSNCIPITLIDSQLNFTTCSITKSLF